MMMRLSLPLFCLVGIVAQSCNSSKQKNTDPTPSPFATVTKRAKIYDLSPLVAKGGETVDITGKNLTQVEGIKAHIKTLAFSLLGGTQKTVRVKVISDGRGEFTMPDIGSIGQVSVSFSLEGGGFIGELNMISNTTSNEIPILTIDKSLVCNDIEFMSIEGVKTTGTRTCSSQVLADCSSDGELNCKAVSSFPAADSAVAISANIRTGITIAGVNGSLVPTAADCTANSSNCFLPSYSSGTQPLKAIDYDAIAANAASIKSSLTIAGVNGTLANCSADGSTNCVTTASFKSADMSVATAGNIKSGVTIAGTPGEYPSASYKLPTESGTANLTSATFNAKVKSSTAFEYWDSDGTRYTGAGDDDLIATNIKDTVSIFSELGTYTGSITIDPWDLRHGVVAGAVTGKLKLNCRNGAATSSQNITIPKNVAVATGTPGVFTVTAHGFNNDDAIRFSYGSTPTPLSFSTTYYVRNKTDNTFEIGTTAGAVSSVNVSAAGSEVTVFRIADTVLDPWDTIDDYNANSGPVLATHPWSNTANYCNAVGTASDDSVWTDVTLSVCDSAGDECRFKDKISGLHWTEIQNTGASWGRAISGCDSLTWDTATDWRLPTAKELMDAYTHGIYLAQTTNWLTKTNLSGSSFWASTSRSDDSSSAFAVSLTNGYTANGNSKGVITLRYVCVRP